jgi:outer membrane protein assembly factor BamB
VHRNRVIQPTSKKTIILIILGNILVWSGLIYLIQNRDYEKQFFHYQVTPGWQAAEQQPGFPLEQKWCYQNDSDMSRPFYYDGMVYVVDQIAPAHARILAFTKYGAILWQKNIGGLSYISNPLVVVDDDQFYSDDTNIYALDRRTGKEHWKYEFHGVDGLTVGRGKLIATKLNSMIALSIQDGRKLWDLATKEKFLIPVLDTDSNKLILDGYTFRVLDPDTGLVLFEKPRTPTPNQSGQTSTPFFTHGHYFRDIQVFDITSGRVLT